MNEEISDVVIESLTKYNEGDARDIGRLLPYLSTRFEDNQVDKQLLSEIIASDSHDVLVARNASGTIVGTATLSVVYGTGAGRKAQLEDFVVDPSTQGMGIGSKLWDRALDWSKERGCVKLYFTSNPSRTKAHQFYLARGAQIKDTAAFSKTIE